MHKQCFALSESQPFIIIFCQWHWTLCKTL